MSGRVLSSGFITTSSILDAEGLMLVCILVCHHSPTSAVWDCEVAERFLPRKKRAAFSQYPRLLGWIHFSVPASLACILLLNLSVSGPVVLSEKILQGSLVWSCDLFGARQGIRVDWGRDTMTPTSRVAWSLDRVHPPVLRPFYGVIRHHHCFIWTRSSRREVAALP